MAQTTQKIYYGYLRDSAMGSAIVNATVTNQQTKQIVETDKLGFFAIPVNKGDLLLFSAIGYGQDSLRFFPYLPDTTHIELPRLATKLDVTVKSTSYSKYQQDSADRRERFLADAGPRDKTFTKASSGAGLGINLKWNKKDRLRKQTYDHFEEQEQQHYIDYRFNPETVGYYTRLKGDSLNLFMGRFRPDYEFLRKNTTIQDLIYYLNEKLKIFFNREEQP
ncbi:hypothetical protein [Filimonas lacunae]|nr:hypothetical protein [Filimonas lacunae]BAV09613.1 hypothetical protein FLA_5664 [Filimonas lacunae]